MNLKEKYQEALGVNVKLHLLIIYPNTKNAIEVIDNQFQWEVDDFDTVTKRVFYDLDEVIFIAKKLAERRRLCYIPFESRYCGFKESESHDIIITEDDIDELEAKYYIMNTKDL